MSKILIDLPETIQTSRLILQVPKAGLGQKFHEAMSDGYEDYVKWLDWPIALPTPEQIEEQCREHYAKFILRDFLRYLIIDKATLEIVGATAFPPTQLNWAIPQFGIAYFIRRSARSNGYATEAAHAMSILAFKVLKARKVQIFCDEQNIASIKVPLTLGFSLEYTQRGGFPRFDGELTTLQAYSVFAADELNFVGNVNW